MSDFPVETSFQFCGCNYIEFSNSSDLGLQKLTYGDIFWNHSAYPFLVSLCFCLFPFCFFFKLFYCLSFCKQDIWFFFSFDFFDCHLNIIKGWVTQRSLVIADRRLCWNLFCAMSTFKKYFPYFGTLGMDFFSD